MSRQAARKFAARQLAQVFDKKLSHRTIEYWQDEHGALTPADELMVATGFTTAGGQPHGIGMYFVGLAHLAMNPTVAVVRDEGSGEGWGYLRNSEET